MPCTSDQKNLHSSFLHSAVAFSSAEVDCAVCSAIIVTYATLVALVYQSLLSWWILRTVALWGVSLALEDRSGPINRLHYCVDMLYCISTFE